MKSIKFFFSILKIFFSILFWLSVIVVMLYNDYTKKY